MSAAVPRRTCSGYGSGADRFSVDAVVRKTAADGVIEVELGPASRCSGCAGTCMWTFSDGARPARLACSHSLCAGDVVRVHLPAENLLRGTLLLHGLPLASLLVGGGLGAFVGQSDLSCFVGAVAGIALMLSATPSLRRRVERLTVERVSVEPRDNAALLHEAELLEEIEPGLSGRRR